MKEIGIYIHIPFCKKACHYCNFHFSTSMKLYDRMVNAIKKELEIRRNEWAGFNIRSIYFGGGTPSLLKEKDLKEIIALIRKEQHPIDPKQILNLPEITLEANPDDLDVTKIEALLNAGINRVSLGVQSFFDDHLVWMNRSHNVEQAHSVLDNLKRIKEIEISADLIFALPMLSNDQWVQNLEKLATYNIQHWSCYNLTIEPKTVLHYRVKKGIEKQADDHKGANQFELLMDFAVANGMDHYEISNYCKPNKYAIHNTSYWQEKPYVGIGPSAHSFDGKRRSWNVANNSKYIEAIEHDSLNYRTFEERSTATTYNEYVMTRLRTKWGVELKRLERLEKLEKFDRFESYFLKEVNPLIKGDYVNEENNIFTLTRKGKLHADWVASELFWVD